MVEASTAFRRELRQIYQVCVLPDCAFGFISPDRRSTVRSPHWDRTFERWIEFAGLYVQWLTQKQAVETCNRTARIHFVAQIGQ